MSGKSDGNRGSLSFVGVFPKVTNVAFAGDTEVGEIDFHVPHIVISVEKANDI